MTDVIYTHQTGACWLLSWTPLSTDCASARGGGGVSLPRCQRHGTLSMGCASARGGRWNQSAPLSTACASARGGRSSQSACHCSGYCRIIRQELWKEIWFWQRFQYTSVIHVHHRVFYEVSQTYNLTQCHMSCRVSRMRDQQTQQWVNLGSDYHA